MTTEGITHMVTALGNLVTVLAEADPTDKAEIYRQIGLTLTYHPEDKRVQAEVRPDAGMYVRMCPRGGLGPRSWWYIPEPGIYHQPKLTRKGPAGPAIRRRKEAAAPARLTGPGA
jgi:hypothetical protein